MQESRIKEVKWKRIIGKERYTTDNDKVTKVVKLLEKNKNIHFYNTCIHLLVGKSEYRVKLPNLMA